MTVNRNRKWKPRKLDELGFVGRGKSRHRPRNAPELYGGPYPFFQTGDIKAADLFLRKCEQTYSETGLAQSKLWKVGTLCITIAANIAETAILAIPGCFPDSVVGFNAYEDESDVRFIKYYIDTIKLHMQNVSKGTTQDNLSVDKLLTFDFVVPDITTQRKIAGVLSAYDDLIENNTRRIAILEEMAQAIYREWFVNFRFPGHEKVKLVDSPLGKIPEGWKWAKLKDVCVSVNYGYTASANKAVEVGPRFLRITDIVPKTIDWENVPYCEVDEDDAAKFALHEGDIVIARTGATTGYAKRLHKRHPKSVFASYLVRIVPNKTMGKHYVGLIVESDDYKTFIKRNLGGAAQPQANAQVLTSLDVLVPSQDVITAFDCRVEPLADQKEILQLKTRNLRKTRDLLLPKLISGQLDVEDLDIETGERLMELEA